MAQLSIKRVIVKEWILLLGLSQNLPNDVTAALYKGIEYAYCVPAFINK